MATQMTRLKRQNYQCVTLQRPNHCCEYFSRASCLAYPPVGMLDSVSAGTLHPLRVGRLISLRQRENYVSNMYPAGVVTFLRAKESPTFKCVNRMFGHSVSARPM